MKKTTPLIAINFSLAQIKNMFTVILESERVTHDILRVK